MTPQVRLYGQSEKSYHVICAAFYNLENLFDTILDSGLRNNEEFTPEGPNAWDTERYHSKLKKLAEVISGIGTGMTPDGPAILGVSEVENRRVLEDLVKEPVIRDRNYRIAHFDSPDRRGIDVALLYQPEYFTLTNARTYSLYLPHDTAFRTRDQLVVSGRLDGEMFHFIVNHWPSRRGGEKRSRPLRNAAGQLCRHITDSLLQLNPMAKLVIMGDLNDDPVNPSVKEHLRTKGKEEELQGGDLFNPMMKMYRDGVGSLAYRDSWNLFDQIIVSQALLGKDYSTWKIYGVRVYNESFLVQKEGAFTGYPLRTFAGGVYMNGYSDHFPVYLYLIREVN
ncbi:MAG: endonuclease/exonuclease/phosphatase family protein [Bacteroidales bacterium]|nr:endonuclease/exonuclease/phosphatase family protein [Bacteroidales bacterium]